MVDVNVLTLVEQDRTAPSSPGQRDRARYVVWLREPLQQLDFGVDGLLLSERLRTLDVPRPETFGLDPFDMLSVADLAWPAAAASSLRQLAAVEPRSDDWPLAPGRLPVFVCPMCADLGCGAITVHVARDQGTVTWSDFRMENGFSEAKDVIDLSALGPFTFDVAAYEAALLGPTGVLDALAADELAAHAEWKADRGLRGLVRRLRDL